MQINPQDIAWKSMYKLMIGAVVPRPIGWVSSVDVDGNPNLAPYSFFNAVCPNPPHVLFCTNVRGTDASPKDTLRNVRDTGEFIINIVTEATAAAMNLTAQELPATINEFEHAGLSALPSVMVKPPRVGESPINFECEVVQIVDLSDAPGGGSVVIGRVVYLHIDDNVMIGDDKIDLQKLQPVGRLAGAAYARVTDIFSLNRPPSQIKES